MKAANKGAKNFPLSVLLLPFVRRAVRSRGAEMQNFVWFAENFCAKIINRSTRFAHLTECRGKVLNLEQPKSGKERK